MRLLARVLLALAVCASAQAHRGELRLDIADPVGAAVPASIELTSKANGYDRIFTTDKQGRIAIQSIPFGTYDLRIELAGFAQYHAQVAISSAIPEERKISLALPLVSSSVRVSDKSPLLDPSGDASSATQVGTQQIEQRPGSLPGRSVQDLIVTQPGWLYEGNAVLHPRGSEYQTQYVLDGIPLTENRSPGFGTEVEADDLESLSVYTAGFPAEYGRKMGGVVELNTRHADAQGTHGTLVVSGGSYESVSGFAQVENVRGKNAFQFSISGAGTAHYLNPVVPENYTNRGTDADFSLRYEREFANNDRLSLTGRRELARYLIPNEYPQQAAGQRENGEHVEDFGAATYQHILSPDSMLVLSGMGRANSGDLESNTRPTPIAAFQANSFEEGYGKASYSLHRGHHDVKVGVESDALMLHEDFHYDITDATQFDPGTAPSLQFAGSRRDLEQAAFMEDRMSARHWSVSAGLRWDHYQLLLNQLAWSPRLSVARYFAGPNLSIHATYDRIFQTPSFENILLSSTSQVAGLSGEFLRLPVQPSRGNDYEVGMAKGLRDFLRADVNGYWRRAGNFADDDQLLNTGISYPIAFEHASIYGAEAKVELRETSGWSGFASYSYMVGKVWFPVTGGLFLGEDAANAAARLSGHFPDSQDQRNTVAGRFSYQCVSRVRVSGGAFYGSGLPFAYGGTEQRALDDYGAAVVSRLNFARGRVRPNLAVNASLAVEVYRRESLKITARADGENLNDRLNVLDFGGLFSGNAIGPARSGFMRLDAHF